MITLFESKSGRFSAEADGKIIHSRYDPVREAERFIDEQIKAPPSTAVLLGPGIGYLYTVLRKRYPHTKIISVSYSRTLFREFRGVCRDPCLFFSKDIILYRELSSLLVPADLEGFQLIEWPVLSDIFPAKSASARTIIRRILKQLSADLTTTSRFGKKWIKNCVRNFLNIDTIYALPPQWRTFPVIIAASGPSLADQIGLLRTCRNGFVLWALPSSLAALDSAGIRPDLVVSTDAGYFAGLNLREGTPEHTVACPLSSYVPPWLASSKKVLIRQNTFAETSLLQGLDSSVYPVYENGTVAGTALELAVLAGFSSVIFAGLDLAFRDIQEHVKPHAFDVFFLSGTRRTRPLSTSAFARASALSEQTGGRLEGSFAYNMYASWFETAASSFPVQLYRLSPVPYELKGMPSLSRKDFQAIIDSYSPATVSRFSELSYPNTKERVLIGEEAARSWIDTLVSFSSFPFSEQLTVLRSHGGIHSLLYSVDPLLLKQSLKYFSAGETDKSGAFIEGLTSKAIDFYRSLLYRMSAAHEK